MNDKNLDFVAADGSLYKYDISTNGYTLNFTPIDPFVFYNSTQKSLNHYNDRLIITGRSNNYSIGIWIQAYAI